MRALRIIFAVVALVGLGLVGAGVVLIVHRDTDARARATITECEQVTGTAHADFECSGSWVVGGALVGGAGHVVLGPVEGAEPSDVGKTLDVTIRGDHAYTRSLRIPIILLIIGLLLVGGSVWVVIGAARQDAARRRNAPAA
jgi:hypothetical protein